MEEVCCCDPEEQAGETIEVPDKSRETDVKKKETPYYHRDIF